jgi:hypothetical protein
LSTRAGEGWPAHRAEIIFLAEHKHADYVNAAGGAGGSAWGRIITQLANILTLRCIDCGEFFNPGHCWLLRFLVSQWRESSRIDSLAGGLEITGPDFLVDTWHQCSASNLRKRENSIVSSWVVRRCYCCYGPSFYVGDGLIRADSQIYCCNIAISVIDRGRPILTFQPFH